MRKQQNTLEARLSRATALTQNALSLFENAAADLEVAASAADVIFDEIESEVLRLSLVQKAADAERTRARTQARKIREFVQ
jgi:hypothetical protein